MKFVKKTVITVCAFIIICVSAFAYWAHRPLAIDTPSLLFSVRPGSLSATAKRLAEQGVKINTTLFILLARLTGNGSKLKVGYYEIKPGDTPWVLMTKLAQGKFVRGSVTIVEGWNFRQMRNALAAHDGLQHDTSHLSDRELLKFLGISYQEPEGLFFPDTYVFPKGTPESTIYKQAHAAMIKRLNALWKNRDASLPYKNPYDALIMASIVEKETGLASDRDTIAGVFVNRLRIGMRLQTDPTVIYGMGEAYQGNIRKVDLQTDTPYNTYTRHGLPPTPIALPGQAALTATFKPADTKALYFVSRNDGSSQFSDNLADHNTAVNKYQRLK